MNRVELRSYSWRTGRINGSETNIFWAVELSTEQSRLPLAGGTQLVGQPGSCVWPGSPLNVLRVASSSPYLSRLTAAERSALMARIRSTGTSIERRIAQLLRARGVHFSENVNDLPGRPDVVLAGQRLAVFLDGDFWHGRTYNAATTNLNEAWKTKIERTMARDRRATRALRARGWRVLRFWESDIRRTPDRCVERILEIRAQCVK